MSTKHFDNSKIPMYTPRILIRPGIMYRPDGGGEGGGNTDPDPDDEDEEETPPADEGKKDESIKLTPAELKNRLARAEKRSAANVLKSLGFDKAEDIKAKLARLDELESANLSDSDKLKKAHDTEKARADQATALLTRMADERKADAGKREIENALRTEGITDSEDLEYAVERAQKFLAKNHPDAEEFDADNLTEFLEKLKDTKPMLFGEPNKESRNTGNSSQPPKGKKTDTSTKASRTLKEVSDLPPEDFANAVAEFLLSQK